MEPARSLRLIKATKYLIRYEMTDFKTNLIDKRKTSPV